MTASCDLPTLLARARAASPVEAVDVLADDLRALLDAIEVRFLVTNVTGRSAVVYAGTGANAARVRENGERPELIPLPGTPYETALRAQTLLRRAGGNGGETILAPVSDHGDALGVIEVQLDRAATTRGIEDLLGVTGVLAHLLIAVRRHSDLEDWAESTESFSLAAEIQRRLLPGSYTCDTSVFSVSGWLEPANAVGGDTFDYSVDRDTLHLSITDAVGNDVNAALLASVLMGSLRNSRRNGATLADQARRANDALAAHSAVGQFVTGQLARVDLRSGRMLLVNAGHPFPYRIRGGRVEEIELTIDMPFGLFPGRELRVQEIDLRPGDRILLLTDGMLERNAVRLDLPAMLTASVARHPREVVYELAEAVLHGTGGRLDDDATILCLDWRG
jgi:serine phosphatase RsbU (regulator of sigma subunit)